MRGGNLVEESATVLGIDASALKDELQQGKTLAEIAKAKGLTEEVFLQKLEAAEKTRIASAVSSGKITQAQADKMLSGLADRLKQQIENNHPQHDMRGGRRGGPWGDHQALAKVLGMTADELQTQLQSGKSLAEIAQAKGISEDQLITKIKDGMTDQLKRFVEQKGMPGHMQPPAGQQNNAQ